MYKNYDAVTKILHTSGNLFSTQKTFEDIYQKTILDHSNLVSTIYVDENGKVKKYKFGQFHKYSDKFAAVIKNKINAPKGSIVGLKMNNNPHWGETAFAILKAGYKPLLIDAKTNQENTINLLKQVKAVGIVSDDFNRYEEKKVTLANLLDGDDVLFSADWENEVILCSSGTTGDVKLMVYNGENMVHQIAEAYDIGEHTGEIMYPGDLRVLAMIPFHHVFGFVAVFLWFSYFGKTLVYPLSNTPSDLQFACQKCKVSHILSVPLFWDSLALGLKRKFALLGEDKEKLLENMIAYNVGEMSKKEAGLAAKNFVANKIKKQLLGKHIRFCISGGGFLSYETLRTINGIGYPLYDGYGMTEIGIGSVELSPDVKQRLKGSIGQPFHGVEYKIDKNGELLIRSKAIHCKEIIKGEARAAQLTEDGYFRSGDIAEVDENGNYTLKGRIKDIIVNADGENIFPDELEIYFKELPHTVHLCVLGIAKKNSKDEDVDIVLELDNSTSEEDMNEIKQIILKTKLPHNVAIKDIYLAKGKLPLANNMKVKRLAIKKAIEAGSEEYALLGQKKKENKLEGLDQSVIDDLLPKMKKIFSKILILPEFKIENDAHWINNLGGDSMSYVELIKECQDQFNIVFPDEDLTGNLTCINDFIYEIAKLQKEQNK